MPRLGKITFVILIVLAIVGFFYLLDEGSDIVNPNYITISYIAPLPYGSIKAEINANFLTDIQEKYNEFKSKVPFIESEVPENSEFLVRYTITAPEKYEETSIAVDSSGLLQDIELRDGGGNILSKDENNRFIFQNDLYQFDDTNLIVTGKTKSLGSNSYSGENLKLVLFSKNEPVFESELQTIKICKKNVPDGCSDKLKQFSLLLQEVIKKNVTTEESH